MGRRFPVLEQVKLKGLTVAPSQVWGAIRLVPLLRPQAQGDLRLAARRYGENLSLVSVGSEMRLQGEYVAYVPHGLVLSWTSDGSPVASFGTHLFPNDGRRVELGPWSVRLTHRMARREDPHRLRILPMHLAMEGFLALHARGPDVMWSEYSRHVRSHGLLPRMESAVPGRAIWGLDEALRVFEIHEGQVGVLLFVADALASTFVTPHPDDYRALHRTLLEDFYGELLYQYGVTYSSTPRMETGIRDDRVESLADLRAELARMRRDWGDLHHDMAAGVLGCAIRSERVYHAGPFQLERFMTGMHPGAENHIGEAIVREDGTLEYLKTYRLSAAQTRRAYLLMQLAAHNWNLQATAAGLHTTYDELIVRLDRAGFGYLVHEHVLKTAQKHRREMR